MAQGGGGEVPAPCPSQYVRLFVISLTKWPAEYTVNGQNADACDL